LPAALDALAQACFVLLQRRRDVRQPEVRQVAQAILDLGAQLRPLRALGRMGIAGEPQVPLHARQVVAQLDELAQALVVEFLRRPVRPARSVGHLRPPSAHFFAAASLSSWSATAFKSAITSSTVVAVPRPAAMSSQATRKLRTAASARVTVSISTTL